MTEKPQIKLYNTLTRRKEAFEPIDPTNVRMYVCGPTVYDHAHIGNARPVIVFDVLYRLLKHLYPGAGDAADGSRVTYVRNITDVDDKIIARARRDFPDLPLNEAIREVTEKTAADFKANMKALGCLDPTHEPRATEFVLPREDGKADMVSMIQTLLAKNHAYVARGEQGREVLFRVESMADYGALSNRRLDQQKAGARVAVEDHKRHPGDFVLWKESSDDEPGWDATFDGEIIRGRPGWHIECSAMSEAFLGETFDIHGGGLDLIFPHHENEIAQSRCVHGTDVMANIWMHNGFLQVEGKKMSKSEGNFITVHDLLHTDKVGGRRWPGEVIRLAMLMTHYREPIDFSVKRLEEAWGTLSGWRESLFGKIGFGNSSKENDRQYHPMDVDFLANLLVDINFPALIGRLHSALSSRDHHQVSKAWAAIRELGILSFDSMKDWSKYQDPAMATMYMNIGQLERKVDERAKFITEKNWPEADRIRDDLLQQGIQLKDSKDPETGERVTTWEVVR